MALSALNAKVSVVIDSAIEKTENLNVTKENFLLSKLLEFTLGTGINQSNLMWHDRRVLAASANETLAFDGAFADNLGQSFDLDALKVLLIVNQSNLSVVQGTHTVATNAVLEVGAAAANAILVMKDSTDIMILQPGGSFLYTNPTAAGLTIGISNHDLKITETAAEIALYDIFAIGEAA